MQVELVVDKLIVTVISCVVSFACSLTICKHQLNEQKKNQDLVRKKDLLERRLDKCSDLIDKVQLDGCQYWEVGHDTMLARGVKISLSTLAASVYELVGSSPIEVRRLRQSITSQTFDSPSSHKPSRIQADKICFAAEDLKKRLTQVHTS